MKKIWDEIALKGHGLTAGEKLRIWWFAASLVITGSVTDTAPWWISVLLTVNFIASGLSAASLGQKLQGDGREEV
jgi:hypothetical protein